MAARNEPDDRVLVLTRTFDAPRPLVFAAWTDVEHIRRWLAPRGFTIPFCEGDARPGGAFRCCMRSPDGEDHWVSGVYREVVPNERLVYTHAWHEADGARGHETIVTVTFEDVDGKTRLTLHQATFASSSSRDGHREGWSECLDKLAEYLPRAGAGARA